MDFHLRNELSGSCDELRLKGLRGLSGAHPSPGFKGAGLVMLAMAVFAALSGLTLDGAQKAHAAGATTKTTKTTATTPSTAPLLPGEKLWNGVPSYLFGANDAYDWAGSAGLDQQPHIQAAVKSAGLPFVRIWFFEYDENTGAPVSDAQQEAVYQAGVVNTGATCFANLYTTNTVAYDLHIVSLFKGRCEFYEVMNEPESSNVLSAQYIPFWNDFVPKARAIDPNAKFGGPASANPLGYDCTYPQPGVQECFVEKWLAATVASGVAPDFVTFHWYTCWNETASACLSEAGNIKTIGDSTIALVNKYYPGKNIPVGLTEWNSNPGNPSYQYDDTWMSQYEQASLTGLEQSQLSFATQFDMASCAGWGSLDMFNVCAGPSDGSPRPYEAVWAHEIAREINGGVSAGSAPVTPPAPTGSPTGSSSGSSTGSSTGTSTGSPTATNTPTAHPTNTPGSTPAKTPTPVSSTVAPPLFMDDFQSATPGSAPASWTVENGSWTVQQVGTTSGGLPNDVLAQGNPSTNSDYTITAGLSTWTNYTVQARVKPGANDLYQPNDLMARFTNDDNHYSFLLKNNDEWYLGKRVDGTWTTLAQGTYSYSSRFYTLKMTLNGAAITAAIDGKVVATVNDTSFASGKIGFLTSAESALDDVVVTAPGAPIPTTPKPTPKGAACVEVVKGSLTMGTCDGTFTPVFSLSSNGGAVCVEDTNGIMMLGTCSGTFTAKS